MDMTITVMPVEQQNTLTRNMGEVILNTISKMFLHPIILKIVKNFTKTMKHKIGDNPNANCGNQYYDSL